MISYILLAIGLLLIFIEFFLPGGALGIAGGILIILSIVFFAMNATSLWAVILFVVAAIVFLGLLVKFALWRLPKLGVKKGGMYLDTDQEGYVGSSFTKEFIGKKGRALSDLKPSGHIIVEGKRVQAVAKTGYIFKDEAVIVIGGEGGHLIVKREES